MTSRITGTNSGIDVDTVVKEALSTQQTKIDKAYQKQKVYEYQQEQLKDIVSDAASFYDKYLDILSSGNLLSSTTYETATFTSSDNSVSAKGYAGADVTDYKVSVNSIAKKARVTLTDNFFADAIDKESGVFSFEMKNTDGTSTKMYLDLPIEDGEINMSSLATSINYELKKNGISASAKYSEFEKGIVLESTDYGENVSIGVAVKADTTIVSEGETPEGFSYTYTSGENAKGTITKGDHVYMIDKPSNVITVDNVEFTLHSVSKVNTESVETSDISHLSATDSNNKVTFQSLNGSATIIRENNRGVVTKSYSDGITLKTISNSDGEIKTNVSGNLSHLNKDDSGVTSNEDGSVLTKEFKDSNNIITKKTTIINGNTTTTTYEHDGVKIETVTVKETVDGKEKSTTTTTSNGNLDASVLGDNYKTTIESSDGKTRTTILNGTDENGNKKTTMTTVKPGENGTSVELVSTMIEDSEGVTSTTNKINTNEPVTLSGKTDITNLKDTIVKFVDDYNKLMEKINTKLWETRDTDYMPLTDSQKKEMSDTEIEEWEKKAKTGLLRSDSDLRRIQRSMKTAMSSLMSGTGLTLEKIGIKPVDNYTTKNGMFEVDESTLTKALESNSEEVKDLFIRSKSSTDENEKGGVLVQLQGVLRSEVKSSTSMLSKRIGFEGTSTASEDGNTLSKNIKAQKKLIKELQSKYKDKEDALYKKYSNLEVMLEKLNSQSNSLYSMLGLN